MPANQIPFPQYFGLSSPFSESIFLNEFLVEEPNDNIDDDKNTIWTIFRSFDNLDDLTDYFTGVEKYSNGKTIEEELLRYAKAIVICFIPFGCSNDNNIAIRFTTVFGAGLSMLSKSDLESQFSRFADRLKEIGEEPYNFFCDKNLIIKKLYEATPLDLSKLKSLQKIGPEKEKLYELNYNHFSLIAEKPNDPATKQAINRLCMLLVKIDFDVVDTYNQYSAVRYSTPVNKKISLAGLLRIIRTLEKTSVHVKEFQTRDFNNSVEIRDFVNKNFVDPSAIGKETKFVVNYPFKKLSYEQRKKYIYMFMHGSPLEFSGFWEGAHWDGHRDVSDGDIVYNLFITTNTTDRLKLVQEMDNEGELFSLLEGSSGNCFMTLSFIVGCAVLGDINTEEKQKKEMFSAILEQNFFYYDDYEDTKIQKFDYDTEKKLIYLENKGHTIDPRELQYTSDEKFEEHEKKEIGYLAKYASSKTHFSPLEFIIFTAESDINSAVLKALFNGSDFEKLKKDDMLLLPACLVYLIFKEYSDKKKAYLILAAATFLLLPLGIGSLVGAVAAASLRGIFVALTDITFDVIVLAANEPEALENNEERAEFVNILAFFYGLGRIVGSIKPGPLKELKELPEGTPKPNRNLVAALKQMGRVWTEGVDWVKNVFRSRSKGEALFREIFELLNKGQLSDSQFKRIAKKLKTTTGIDMHLVDATVIQFKELYKRWKEKPVYAIFHSHKFRNKNYGLILDGPAIYFFRGGTVINGKLVDVILSSYTMQHELLHIKLWHTLVKEYGAKGGLALYSKIPAWLHEADVIGEFLKQNKTKPKKWPIFEIEKDLLTLNKKIQKIPEWQNSFNKITGKEILTLKDLENWNITNWLK